MVKKWKGIKEIVERATKELVETQEDGYLFYSAPKGHTLILSVAIIELPPWRKEIKDFGIVIKGRKDRILRRELSEVDGRMFIDDDAEPLLELVGEEKVTRHIKEDQAERVQEGWELVEEFKRWADEEVGKAIRGRKLSLIVEEKT